MHQRGGGDQSIPVGLGVEHVQAGAAQGYFDGDGQRAPGEQRQYLRVKLMPQGASLGSIAPLQQQQALLDFLQRDNRHKQIAGGHLFASGGHLGVGTPEPNLANL